MLACVDVDYRADYAVAAALTFDSWTAATPLGQYRVTVTQISPYTPGQFYKRELPCVLAVLAQIPDPLRTIVVDSYVWLPEGKMGMGAYLHAALNGTVNIIGVAKKKFRDHHTAAELRRGNSQNPLYITSEGVPLKTAVAHIACMHGPYRFPTLLKQVDHLARQKS